MKKFSWTLNAPYKEEKYQRLISDSIGNNYTPLASNINMKQIQKRKFDEDRISRGLPVFEVFDSPPMSPESRRVALNISKTISKEMGPPIDLDPVELESKTIAKQITAEQRYWFYVERGINNRDLSALDTTSIKRIRSLIKPSLLSRAETFDILLDEVKRKHCSAIKQSIVDYILLDDSEKERLMIPYIFEKYTPKVCRAPVPWNQSLYIAKDYLKYNLFISNPMMIHILAAFEPYKNAKIVDMSVFTPAILPISVDEFGSILKSQCQAFKQKILNEYLLILLTIRWIPKIASDFLSNKDKWYSIATNCSDPDLGFSRLDLFFKSVTSIMSNQIWEIVANSLTEFENFFSQFADCKSDLSVFLLKMSISGSQIRFDPPLSNLESNNRCLLMN